MSLVFERLKNWTDWNYWNDWNESSSIVSPIVSQIVSPIPITTTSYEFEPFLKTNKTQTITTIQNNNKNYPCT